jgi:hypothetical protein
MSARRAFLEQQGRFVFAKLDHEQRIAFGYASVAVNKHGAPVTDLQGDRIDPAELERAAYAFMHEYGTSGEMHAGSEPIGKVVESFVVTGEKLRKMGLLPDDAPDPPSRWWIGVKLASPAFEKVKSGQYRMFSIQGSAERVPVAE